MNTLFSIRKLFAVCSVSVLALSLSACGSSDSDTKNKTMHELSIMYSDWPPDMINVLAQKKGIFEKYGLDVTLIEDQGLSDAAEIRKNEQIDIWAYTLLDFLTDYATGVETEAQTFLIQDFSDGADGVITLPEYNIEDVSELKGKKVGVEKGTVGEFFLQILLDRKKLTIADLDLVDMSYDDIPEAVQNKSVVAGVTYEPDMGNAVNNGAVILVDTSQERGAIVDVFVAKTEALKNNPEAYTQYARAMLEAGDFLRNSPEEAAEILKDDMNMPAQEVIDTFKKLKIPDLRDNETAFDRSSGHASLYILGRLAQQYLKDQEIITTEFDIEPLLNTEIIRSVKSE